MNRTALCSIAAALAGLAALAPGQGIRPPDAPQTNAIVVTPNPPSYPPQPPVVVNPGPTLQADVWTDEDTYYIGDSIRVRFRVNRDAYVYIFNTDAQGVTTQIFPNWYDQDNYCRGGATYTLPQRGYGYNLQVVGPPGTENVEIYAVTEQGQWQSCFQGYSQSAPFPELSSQGEQALRSIAVTPDRVVAQPNAIVVVPQPTQPAYQWDRDESEFDVIDPRMPVPVAVGGIEVRSTVSHVSISVDGAFVGYGPGVIANLAAGYHNIEVYRPGYRPMRQQIYIQPGRTTVIQANLSRDRRWNY